MRAVAHTDGGSRGNPGPAAAGFVLEDEAGRQLLARACFLGRATNNVAEYTALVRVLEAAGQMGVSHLTVYTDSELMVRQIKGQYKVKSDLILPLFERAKELQAGFERCAVVHVTRDKNKDADRLVNMALDAGEDIEESVTAATSSATSAKSSASQKKLRLGVLISGGGRTMLNILQAIHRGELNAEIAVVISSLSTVAGVDRAREAGHAVPDSCRHYADDAKEQVEIETRFAGYIAKQEKQVQEFKKLERWTIPGDIDYASLSRLSREARERLAQVRPMSVGQATRVSGVSPADVMALTVHLREIARAGAGAEGSGHAQ